MPRVPRIHIEKALYYITSRGDGNQEIFKEAADYAAYLELLKKYKKQYSYRLFAYGLLPNHLHLLIELVKNITISQIMHGLNSNYTKYFSGRYKKGGHLFQERYKMVLAEKDPNLLNLTAYIHLNPKTLKITEDLKNYPYTSYPSYLYYSGSASSNEEPPIDIKEEAKDVTGRLKGRSYQDFIDEVPAGDMDKLGRDLSKVSILGSDDFIEKVKVKVESEKERVDKDSQYKGASKKLMVGSGIAVLLLSFLAFFLYQRSMHMKESFKSQMSKNEAELHKKLSHEEQLIRKDVDERYRADMISYQALSKRLEIEKKKVRDLESAGSKKSGK